MELNTALELDFNTATAKDIAAAYNTIAPMVDLPQRPADYFTSKGHATQEYVDARTAYAVLLATAKTKSAANRANFKTDQNITILVEKNPKRLNTPAWKRWNALTNCVTVGDFMEKVGRREALGDLNHAVKEGLVEVA